MVGNLNAIALSKTDKSRIKNPYLHNYLLLLFALVTLYGIVLWLIVTNFLNTLTPTPALWQIINSVLRIHRSSRYYLSFR